MAKEIERRFIVTADAWRKHVVASVSITQGYLASGETTVRIRLCGNDAFITVKGAFKPDTIARDEFEYPIPAADAVQMLSLCKGKIEKVRHTLILDGREWVVDVFAGDNAGLTLAEIELPDESVSLTVPPWAHEITRDLRLANSSLAQRPWSQWTPVEKEMVLK